MSTSFIASNERIAQVCKEFRIQGELIEAQVITRGNINTTTKVTFQMKDAGQLPLRVTHNNTRSNSVLFDIEACTPLTVIDSDTVMPGLVAFDFGDAIRSAGNDASEDERIRRKYIKYSKVIH